jgi:hypothetical protein
MGIKQEIWMKRIANRNDLTSQLIHFTLGRNIDSKFVDGVDVLLKILREKKIEGSDTQKGFIVGNKKAVCFQDAPLYSACQNIYAEEIYQRYAPDSKVRYIGVGLMFPKIYVFKKGGRPVIYDKTSSAKEYLPKEQWWRIVNFNLENDQSITDWSHEREWRVPDAFQFGSKYATVLLSCPEAYTLFIKRCKLSKNEGIIECIRGIVNIGSVFY